MLSCKWNFPMISTFKELLSNVDSLCHHAIKQLLPATILHESDFLVFKCIFPAWTQALVKLSSCLSSPCCCHWKITQICRAVNPIVEKEVIAWAILNSSADYLKDKMITQTQLNEEYNQPTATRWLISSLYGSLGDVSSIGQVQSHILGRPLIPVAVKNPAATWSSSAEGQAEH